MHIAPFREDATTYGTPTWIWAVVVEGDLYVRAYNGQNSRWYQAAMKRTAGRITAAGMMREVSFEPVEDAAINDLIDDAYRAKYHNSPYLSPMIGAGARAATVRRASELVEAIGAGWLRMGEDTAYDLKRASEAHRDIEGRGTRGKLYLTP